MEVDRIGLCRDCAFARIVESGRGSQFYRCQLSDSDSRFARYPRLPVVSCSGYERAIERPTDEPAEFTQG